MKSFNKQGRGGVVHTCGTFRLFTCPFIFLLFSVIILSNLVFADDNLQPSLPAGDYTLKRIIDIDPNDVWINYGQEEIDTITVTEDMENYGINLEKTGEDNPATNNNQQPSPGGGGGGGGNSVTNIVNIYNVTNIIKESEEEKVKGEEPKEDNREKSEETEESKEESGLSAITGAVTGIFSHLSSEVIFGIILFVLLTIIASLVMYIHGSRKK